MASHKGSAVLEYLARRVKTITTASVRTKDGQGKLTEAGYRLSMSDEPDAGINGKFYVDWDASRPHDRTFGDLRNHTWADVVVEVGYHRGGGDYAGGDKKSVAKVALDDCQVIADVVENPADTTYGKAYDSDATGIREIRFQGVQRLLAREHADVWGVRFAVQWQSDWITT